MALETGASLAISLSQELLAYMEKMLIYIGNNPFFSCPAVWGTRKYKRMSSMLDF